MERGYDIMFNTNFNITEGVYDNQDPGSWGYLLNKFNKTYNNPVNPNIRSKFNRTKFINYRGQEFNRNTYKPYGVEKLVQGSVTVGSPEDEKNIENQHDLSIGSLIRQSQGLEGGKGTPMVRFEPRDFLYCKDLNKYPNNRLVVLRRFPGPISDQVFGPFGVSPIATIVTQFPPQEGGGGDKLPYSISFHEKQEPYDKNLFETIKDVLKKAEIPLPEIIPNHPIFKTLQARMMQALGITPLSTSDFFGNPNVISSTHARPTANDPSADGLATDITFEVNAAYEYRYINGIDPATAMLDIMANIIRMGTSDSVFQINAGFATGVKSTFDMLQSGKITAAIKVMVSALIDVLKTAFNAVVNFIKGTAEAFSKSMGEGISYVINTLGALWFEQIFAEKRAAIYAAVAASTGAPAGHWHVMVGNPKKPIISCGDLVIQGVTIEFDNQLTYDDQPTTIYAKFTLKNARPRGAQEIETIFNAGQQRIYYSGIVANDTIPTTNVEKVVDGKKTQLESNTQKSDKPSNTSAGGDGSEMNKGKNYKSAQEAFSAGISEGINYTTNNPIDPENKPKSTPPSPRQFELDSFETENYLHSGTLDPKSGGYIKNKSAAELYEESGGELKNTLNQFPKEVTDAGKNTESDTTNNTNTNNSGDNTKKDR